MFDLWPPTLTFIGKYLTFDLEPFLFDLNSQSSLVYGIQKYLAISDLVTNPNLTLTFDLDPDLDLEDKNHTVLIFSHVSPMKNGRL